MTGARTKRARRLREIFPIVAELENMGARQDSWWASRRIGREPDVWLSTGISRNDRGDDVLDESNYETAERIINDASPFGTDYRQDAWPGGVIHTLLVRRDDAAALREVQGILSRLADYPVLDESDYSDREWDANHPSDTECYAEEGCPCENRARAAEMESDDD